MCSINGFNWEDSRLLNKMNKVTFHRGPDNTGSYVMNNISLGHNRLSIIDLSVNGVQPMKYEPYYYIVFNGEIYNYIELKNELINLGYTFKTETDTEVILASYMQWGEECVNHFNGDWAFVIYDEIKKLLFCSRDRLGCKPFYYYNKDDKFIFSSELKGILKHDIDKTINKNAVELYFSLGMVPSPYSIFNNIYKLEAGHNMVFDLSTKILQKYYKYYNLPYYNPIKNKKLLIEKGRELLKDSIKLRMRSDVPVGAFLSGGLDSSAVVSSMRDFTHLNNLHTFSMGFDIKQYDETKYINEVTDAFKTIHHHYYFKEQDFIKLLDDYAFVYDEPFADYSGFPCIKISELAKKDVTVCLSGDGGDEIFGGYTMHQMGAQMEIIKKVPKFIRKLIIKLPAKKNLTSRYSLYLLKRACELSLFEKRCFYSKALSTETYAPEIYKKWTEDKLEESLIKSNNNLSDGLRIYDLLYNTLSDRFCVKVDRSSMYNALEVRSPFLDYRFMEFAQQIPHDLKCNVFKTKRLMREIIKPIVPKIIVNRGKQGFSPPINEWILDPVFDDTFKQALEIIKPYPEIYQYYIDKVFNDKSLLYVLDRIKLFTFYIWYKRWMC
jgi:asparagine synthase (glutamine-hydrolysing)